MELSSLVGRFLESAHGRAAASALSARGYGDDDARQILQHSASAGADHVQAAHQAGGGHHTGASFFAAFASGLVHGDGIRGSLEDGAVGVVEGRIAGLLTARLGYDSAAADAAAAATAPYVVAFLREHLRL